MMRLALALAAGSIVLALAGGALAAPAKFEGAVVPSTPQFSAGFFRIEVATGQTWQAWGAATQFSPVVDSAPLPPGDYHLYSKTATFPDGKQNWMMERMDSVTGRAWVALGGGNVPLVWNEVLVPK